jgi:creatinine amidohydrolase
MFLPEMTWTQIEDHLRTKKTIIFPVGSTEQHGPSGLIGTDYITAWEVARQLGQKTQTLVAAPLCFGMAVHHMAFPGTMTLSPVLYTQVITELLQSLLHHGFEKIILINGHGGNIAPITTAFCQVKQKNETCDLKLVNWWHLKSVQDYEKEHFGDDNGFHATVGEISATMAILPEAFKTIVHPTDRANTKELMWPMSPSQFRSAYPDGRMGSSPRLATGEHGKKLIDLAVQELVSLVE